MYKGIFWVKGGELITVKVMCDAAGDPLEPCGFSSKSGENFNHRAEWKKLPRNVTGGHQFDYYPRGRVEISRGRISVFLNPVLCTDVMKEKILASFALIPPDCPLSARFIPDGSAHYRSILSEEEDSMDITERTDTIEFRITEDPKLSSEVTRTMPGKSMQIYTSTEKVSSA